MFIFKYMPAPVFQLYGLMLICLLGSAPLLAQVEPDSLITPEKERFFKFSPGIAFQQGRDEGMSPLIYSGSHFNGVLGLEKTKLRNYNALDVEMMFGRMRPQTQPKDKRSSALALRLQMDYSYMKMMKTWNADRLQLFIGGAFNNMLNVLWHRQYLNNSLNYTFSSSLGAAARLQYRFVFRNKAFRAHTQINLPLVGFNLRPSYASSIPEGYIAQDRSNLRAFFDSGRLQTWNNFFRLRHEIGVSRILFNRNEIMFTYRWDYYSVAHEHRIQMAVHQIILGWRFRF